MAQKADMFEVELDSMGQNTVIGEDLVTYFRKDHCVYLTKNMFQYLMILATTLSSKML